MILHLLDRDMLDDLWFEVNVWLADDIAAGQDDHDYILHESDTAVWSYQIGQEIIDRDSNPAATIASLEMTSSLLLVGTWP